MAYGGSAKAAYRKSCHEDRSWQNLWVNTRNERAGKMRHSDANL